jgi:hypothetical protein
MGAEGNAVAEFGKRWYPDWSFLRAGADMLQDRELASADELGKAAASCRTPWQGAARGKCELTLGVEYCEM